jgi:hypothetical protein
MNWFDVEKKILEGKNLDEEQRDWVKKKINDYWDNHPDVHNRYPRWKKYLAWVAGYQNFDYNKITKKLVEVPLDRNRRLIINKLKPYVRTLLAKLSSDNPQPSVVPNTSEDEDVRAARIADKVIEGLSTKLEFDRILAELKCWTIICNRAYMHVYWDDSAVGYTGAPKDDSSDNTDPANGPDGEVSDASPSESMMQEVEGDVVIECVSPLNCRPDTLYWQREKWRWFLYGDEVDSEALERKYKLKSGTLREKSTTLDTAYDIDLQDDADILITQPDRSQDITGRTVIWKEFWTPKYYIFMAGNKIVDYGPNTLGEIPFFVAEDRLIPINTYDKEFSYNESLIKDAIPVQREYNRHASTMSTALDRASKLKVLTPMGSLLSKKQVVNDYGVFIDYNAHAGEPHQMKLEPFPMEMPQYKADLEREMQSMMSLGPASFGQLPERASHASGTLVNLLLEQDDVVLNPVIAAINSTVSKVWKLALMLVQENYQEERILKVVGEDGLEDIIKFQGAELRNNHDVRIISQAGLPRSRALRVEYLLKMREVGLLPDDKSTLEMLEFGNADKLFKDYLVHERRAYRENRMISENREIDPASVQGWVYPLEDHAIHMKIHLRDRLSSKFELYTDNQKQALELHIQETQQLLLPGGMASGQPSNEQGPAGPQGQPPGPPATPAPGL